MLSAACYFGGRFVPVDRTWPIAQSDESDKRGGCGPVPSRRGGYDYWSHKGTMAMVKQQIANRLSATTSEQEVVALVLDYLSTWTPEELAQLPRNCRPAKRLRDAEDIADCAIELTNARIACQDPNPLLLEMEAFFAHACARLSSLDGPTRPTNAESVHGN